MRVVQTLGRVDKSTSGGMVSDFPKSVPRILGVRIRGFWPPESFRYVLSIPEGFWGSKSADFMYRHSFLLCTISEGFWGSKSADSGCYPSKSLKLRILQYGPPPSPHPRKLVSNSWHITSSSLQHTRLPETLERHCLMQSVQCYDNLHDVQNICFERYQYHLF